MEMTSSTHAGMNSLYSMVPSSLMSACEYKSLICLELSPRSAPCISRLNSALSSTPFPAVSFPRLETKESKAAAEENRK
eukprot:2822025-Rhodomonas_salina.1